MGAVSPEVRREPTVLAILAVAVCGAACSSASHPARVVVGTGAFTATENPCGRSARPPIQGQILDLFSRGSLDQLRFEGGHVLTVGGEHWAFWNLENRLELAEGLRAHVPLASGGYTYGFTDLAGSLLVTETIPDVFEVRAAYDGTMTTTIASKGTAQVGLAPDGTYFWTATSAVLSAWAPNGTLLVAQPGDYSTAKIAAVPGELHVADGPAGVDRLEVVDTVLAQDHVSDPLPGVTNVMFWFADGQRVYTTDGISQEWVFDAHGGPALATGTSLFLDGGYGDYMWRAPATGGQVEVFSVSGGLQPSTSFFACDRPGIDRGRLVFPAPATSNAGCGEESVMATVNLRGPVVEIDVSVHPDVFGPQLVFSEDGSAYVWPAGNGAVRGSDGGALGCGYVHAIAGADDGTVALATDIGVVIATATADGGRGVGVFDVPAQQVDISGDGRTVAATAPGVAWTFSVPSTSLLHTWGKLTTLPGANDVDVVRGFSMARSGDHVAVSFLKGGGMTLNPEYEIRLTDPGGQGKVSTLPAADPAVLLSPTGAYLIATDDTGQLVIDEGTKPRATPSNLPTAWWDERVYVARTPDGAGGWLPAEARDVDGGLVPGVTIASENVDGYAANNVQVLGVSYFPPVIPYANGLNYSQPAHQILDRATGALVVDAPGVMIAGPIAITQTATLLVGRPLP